MSLSLSLLNSKYSWDFMMSTNLFWKLAYVSSILSNYLIIIVPWTRYRQKIQKIKKSEVSNPIIWSTCHRNLSKNALIWPHLASFGLVWPKDQQTGVYFDNLGAKFKYKTLNRSKIKVELSRLRRKFELFKEGKKCRKNRQKF